MSKRARKRKELPVLECFVDERGARAYVRVPAPGTTDEEAEPVDRQRVKLRFYRLIAMWGYDPDDLWSKHVGAAVLRAGDLERLREYFQLREITEDEWLNGE